MSIFIMIIMINIFSVVVYAFPDVQVTIGTNKQSYSSGELVNVYGDLKRDGTPVTNALIAIQINDAQNNIVSIRTRSTGTTPSPWSIDITKLISCDLNGNPRDTFKRGTNAHFKATLKNLAEAGGKKNVTIVVNLYDSNLVSLGIAWTKLEGVLGLGPGEGCEYTCSIPIPEDASVGIGYAFANAYNTWPKENGIAYCGEKPVAFTITDSTTSSSSSTSPSSTTQPGTYNLTFRLRSQHPLGDHTVYASYYQTLATTKFDVVWLLTDIDRNGKVDILDIATAAKAYGSYPGHPRWNPKADLDGNNKIDIIDIAKVARDYGKIRT
jgi:hypothetical protein